MNQTCVSDSSEAENKCVTLSDDSQDKEDDQSEILEIENQD